MPTEESTPDLFAKFSPENVDELYQEMNFGAVDLGFPRFEIRTELPLAAPLREMGMPLAFDASGADFSLISNDEPLFLEDVIHEAIIKVDEKGTEAAAATGVGIGSRSVPQDVIAMTFDRPFVFLIRDRETGAIIFAGQLVDPS